MKRRPSLAISIVLVAATLNSTGAFAAGLPPNPGPIQPAAAREIQASLQASPDMKPVADPAARPPAPAPQHAPALRAAAASSGVVLNPGDMLQVIVPGESAFTVPFRIERNGTIELPEVGPVEIAGLSVAQAKERLREALSRSYRDLGRFNLVLKEHKLLVTVLGFVKTPGQVELAANANIQQAIMSAGGLLQGAQLDRMQLRRDGRAVPFDYKRYLDGGDENALPQLRPLDEIFVPSSPLTGNVQMDYDARTLRAGDASEDRTALRVFGEVNQPGSFAWKDGMSVMDALMRAGGVTRYAGTDQIRIFVDGKPALFDLKKYLDTGKSTLNPQLAAGSTIFVPAQTEQIRNGTRTVYVMGEVAHPGAFEMGEHATFFDVFANSGGPTRYAETRQVRIIRSGGRVNSFDLSAFTNGSGGTPPEVRGGDAIFVPEKLDGENGNQQNSWLRTPPDQAVRVMGAVRTPGRLAWSDQMSILDLLAQVNGPSERSDLAHVQIISPNGQKADFDLKDFLAHGGDTRRLPRISGGTTVSIPEIPQSPSDMRSMWVEQPADRSIYIMGSVGNPGRFAFKPELSLLDIISAANGPTNTADILNIRVTHRNEARERVSKVNLARYFETGDESLLPRVQPGDVIYVPGRDRNWLENQPQNMVRVLGAVGKPGRYQFGDGMTILDLLAEAGGPSSNALQSKIVVVNMTPYSNHARIFDLKGFATSGDFSHLPVVRAGDTVYVPTTDQSDWQQFFDGVKDAVSVLSIIALLKVL